MYQVETINPNPTSWAKREGSVGFLEFESTDMFASYIFGASPIQPGIAPCMAVSTQATLVGTSAPPDRSGFAHIGSIPMALLAGRLKCWLLRIAAKLRKYGKFPARNEDGSATIEVVLWLPVLVGLFTLIVDASVMFHNHSSVTRMVQDANRAFSVGRYETVDEVEAELLSRLHNLSERATAQTSLNNGLIDTVVLVPAGDLDVIGIFEGLTNFSFTIRAQHLQEI